MVKFAGNPIHPFAVGVIEILAVTGVDVLLMAMNGIIFPAPLDDKPIEGRLFVQVYVEEAIALVKLLKITGSVVPRLQTS